MRPRGKLRLRLCGRIHYGRHTARMADKLSQVLEPAYTGTSTTWQWHPAAGIIVPMSQQALEPLPDLDRLPDCQYVTRGHRPTGAERRQELAHRRQELAGFMGSRRERIAPEQVGLRPAARRRTPGLRREEVATLAGVGVTWYTWLEQGRDINASPQVLDAVARTLLLDPHERDHLFRLADTPDGNGPSECATLPPTAQILLDRLSRSRLVSGTPATTCSPSTRPSRTCWVRCETCPSMSGTPCGRCSPARAAGRACSTGKKAPAGWWPSTAPPWLSTEPSQPGNACCRGS